MNLGIYSSRKFYDCSDIIRFLRREGKEPAAVTMPPLVHIDYIHIFKEFQRHIHKGFIILCRTKPVTDDDNLFPVIFSQMIERNLRPVECFKFEFEHVTPN